MWFGTDFSFLRHIQNTCKSCFAQIRDLKCLRGYLTGDAALMGAIALVGRSLDYFNSLFRSLSTDDLCTSCNVSRIVLLELLPIPPSTHAPVISSAKSLS